MDEEKENGGIEVGNEQDDENQQKVESLISVIGIRCYIRDCDAEGSQIKFVIVPCKIQEYKSRLILCPKHYEQYKDILCDKKELNSIDWIVLNQKDMEVRMVDNIQTLFEFQPIWSHDVNTAIRKLNKNNCCQTIIRQHTNIESSLQNLNCQNLAYSLESIKRQKETQHGNEEAQWRNIIQADPKLIDSRQKLLYINYILTLRAKNKGQVDLNKELPKGKQDELLISLASLIQNRSAIQQ